MRCATIVCAVVMLAYLSASSSRLNAQQREDVASKASDEEPDSGATLHLRTYVNRVQVPTLVLGAHRAPVPDLTPSAFSISLDAGTVFHPTHLRIEGNDPIALAILIDDAGSQPEIVAQLREALTEVARTSLRANDTISIFSADCKMFRTRMNVPNNPADVRVGVQQALNAAKLHQDKKHRNCDASFHLLDYASWMFQQMASLPGRRVALIVSGGHEKDSQIALPAVIRLAAYDAISVFGVRTAAEKMRDPFVSLNALASATHYGEKEDFFDLLCASGGGIILDQNSDQLGVELTTFVQLLRSRYILEFPAPDKGVGGMHGMEVTVAGKRRVLVRSAGASAALPDPTLGNDPNVVPTSVSPAIFGTRRPLEKAKH